MIRNSPTSLTRLTRQRPSDPRHQCLHGAVSHPRKLRLVLVTLVHLPAMLLPLIVLCFMLAGAHTQVVAQTDASPTGPQMAFANQMREIIASAISERKMPGCVLAVGNGQGDLFVEAYGNKQVEPTAEPMTIDTVFDMASITKPVATATAIMKLLEQGRLRRNDTVSSFFPAFASNDKQKITIQDLLLHTSGLIPDNAMSDYADGPEVAWQRICDLKLSAPIGTAFKYSDVNFIVLGKIVEQVSGQSLEAYTREAIFTPLGMSETGFNPSPELRARAAPTEKRDGEWIQGQVHDPRAHALGGIAGHAGLFSTARDMAIYARMMLHQGQLPTVPTRTLTSPTVRSMTAAYRVPSGLRGLGWDKQTGFSTNRGDLLSPSAFGHGGFTGTVLWIDPELDLYFIFLSNRVHPTGDGSVNGLAGRIANLVAATFGNADKRAPRLEKVFTGIDTLQGENFRSLEGSNIGVITNHTGRNASGSSTAELLSRAPGVRLRALFSPEHGFEGILDTAKIQDATDAKTGLRIYSLYGETRRPTLEMLDGIDTLVFDIQDIGTRFYTYISTLGEAMRAAAEHKRRFVVLDRPNPINGIDVHGPMLDPGRESFVGYHRIPVQHGMTTGELAKMFQVELQLDLDLTVIPCQVWTRGTQWDRTGLTWVNPSPNMRSLTQAILYPGVGLLEMTNISVGRGTDTPFEIIGAPWMDGPALATAMNAQSIAGVTFTPVEFTPTSSKHANAKCQGVQIAITNREVFRSVPMGLALAKSLRLLHPDTWDTRSLDRLLGNKVVYDALLDGTLAIPEDPRIHLGLKEFLERRQKFLIYPE
ncbi:MAG: DUF1343 domain-containing protein [Planctomycetes bacterium]|nr:DUF1343 domain-containing protein [Planctomycetota bacterium]